MNLEVSCSRCKCQGVLPNGHRVLMDRPMEYTGQFNVHGVHTHGFHCFGCNGKAHLQPRRTPRTARSSSSRSSLTGSPNEFRPQKLDPHQQMKIDVAYTLGATSGGHHVPTQPITTPAPGLQLDPRNHRGNPAHPRAPHAPLPHSAAHAAGPAPRPGRLGEPRALPRPPADRQRP